MLRVIVAALVLTGLIQVPGAAPTADELVARNIEAKGGLQAIKAVETMRMTGRMTVAPGTEAPFTMEIKRPNKMRMEFTVQGQTGTQAFDGKTGWQILPFAGQKEPQLLPAAATRSLAQQADFDGPLVDAETKGHTVRYVGLQKLDTGEAHQLELKLKTGETRQIYLDAKTYLEVRGEAHLARPGGLADRQGPPVEMISIMGDYRKVDGLMLPHRLESGPKGAPEKMRMTVDKIELNVPMDDSRFVMPKAGQ
jgi:outer membrane lipoprotein-sorting protein